MAPPRRLTPAQVRDRRARIAAVVLTAVLLLVGAFQGPKLLKMLGGKKGTPAAATSSTSASSAPGTAAPSSSQSTLGQLDSFSLLSPQDPFRSQLPKPAVGPTGAKGKAPAATATAATSQKTASPAGTATVGSTPSSPAAVPAAALAGAVAGAEVKMNGRRQLIQVGAIFPKGQPLFQLVTLGHKRVQIGLVTGSFGDGSRTFKLFRGRRITLVDQTDGSRFVIRFVRMTFAPLNLFTVTVAPPLGQAVASSASTATATASTPSTAGGQGPTTSSAG